MSSSAQIPTIQALLLCDHLYQDAATSKFVICGPFTRVFAGSYPVKHPLCYLYFRLVGWQGKGTVRFRHIDLKDNSVLGESGPIPVKCDDLLVGCEYGIRIPPLGFPHAGPYAIDLLWGPQNAPLGDWRFEVVPPPPQPQQEKA